MNVYKLAFLVCLIASFQTSTAGEESKAELTQMQQYDVALGDGVYKIIQSHSTSGTLVVFQANTRETFEIKDSKQHSIAYINTKENYAYECQLKTPVVYYIANKDEYQQAVTVTCGDNIKISEVE